MAIIDNLVSYYKLDENAANTDVEDIHGANEGTASTNTSNLYTVSGKINSAFDFNGSSDKILIGTMGTFASNLGGGVSTSFWVKTTMTARGCPIGGQSSSGTSWAISLNIDSDGVADTGKIHFGIRDNDGTWLEGATTNDINFRDGAWHHIIVTMLPTTNTVVLYLDGSSMPITYRNQQTPDVFSDWSHDFGIGIRNITGTAYDFVDGILDEIGIWDKILTPTEVTELYNSGNGLAYPFSGDVTVSPSTLTLSTTSTSPLYLFQIQPGPLSLTSAVKSVTTSAATTINPNQGTKGTKEISKLNIPAGIGDVQNLVPEGENGIKSTVLSKERVGLGL